MHPNTDEKEFTCDKCAKGFRSLFSFKAHQLKIHKAEFSEKEKAFYHQNLESIGNVSRD